MEILIAVFSGIAFLALIVYLWNSDTTSKQGKNEAAKDESQSPVPVNDTGEASLTLSAIKSEHVAELEQKIDNLNREHAASLNDIESYKQKAAANHFELQEAQATAAQTLQRVVELEADNSVLHRRLAELDNQQSSRQAEMASLHHELGKLNGFEQEAGILRSENAELFEQLKKLEVENAANVQRILALQDLETKQPELEAKLAALTEQNGRLLAEISGLHSSLRDKIKSQLDGLQELYQNLTPRMN
jgi:chromosome segregation ATPase